MHIARGAKTAQEVTVSTEPAVARWVGPVVASVAIHLAIILALTWLTTPVSPYLDEWGTVDLVHMARQGDLRLADVWANHGEHNLFVARVVNLAFIAITDWNRQVMMTIYLPLAVVGLGLLLAAQRTTCGRLTWPIALPTVLLTLSITQYEYWLSPFQMTYMATIVGACCCTWAFSRPQPSRLAFGVAVAGALIASFSSLSGALLWLAFLPAVWWTGKRQLAIWGACGALTIAALMAGEQAVVSPARPFDLSVEHLTFLLAYLGLPLTYPFPAFGIMATFLGGVVILTALWHARTRLPDLGGWYGLLAFSTGCALVTTIGRGPDMLGLTSRYLPFAALWWVAFVVLVADGLRHTRRSATMLHRGGTALLLCMLIATVATDLFALPSAIAFQRAARNADSCVLNYATADDDCLGALLVPDLVRVRAVYLARDRLGPFAGHTAPVTPLNAFHSPVDPKARTLSAVGTRAAIDWCHTYVSTAHVEPVVIPQGSPLAIGGWAVDDVAGTSARGVEIEIDGVPVQTADYGFVPPEFDGPYNNPPYPKSGFRTIIPADMLVPGMHLVTIRVLAHDPQFYYAVSQQVRIEVR